MEFGWGDGVNLSRGIATITRRRLVPELVPFLTSSTGNRAVLVAGSFGPAGDRIVTTVSGGASRALRRIAIDAGFKGHPATVQITDAGLLELRIRRHG